MTRFPLTAAVFTVGALFTCVAAAQSQSLIPGRTAAANQSSILPASNLDKGQGNLLGTTAPGGLKLQEVKGDVCGCVSGTAEGEAGCGLPPPDTTNGGCNSNPNVFGTVSCGETICGTVGTQNVEGQDIRDTDWYELVLGAPQQVTVQVTMETDVLAGNVTGVCAGPAFDQSDTQPACTTASYTFAAGAGTHTLFVAGSSFSGYTCGTEYTMTVSCGDPLEADLELVKTDDADENLIPGQILTYTLTVTNNGPDDATGVVVQDDLPFPTTWVSDDCGAGPPAGNTLTWNIGNLANGASAVCNIQVLVDQAGEIVNFATVSGNESDPEFANNEDDAVVEVQQPIIPTLNQIGLVLLVLSLGVGSVVFLRRRVG